MGCLGPPLARPFELAKKGRNIYSKHQREAGSAPHSGCTEAFCLCGKSGDVWNRMIGQRQTGVRRPTRGIDERTSLDGKWRPQPQVFQDAPRIRRGARRACSYEARQRVPRSSREDRAPRAEIPRQAALPARAVVQRSARRQGRPPSAASTCRKRHVPLMVGVDELAGAPVAARPEAMVVAPAASRVEIPGAPSPYVETRTHADGLFSLHGRSYLHQLSELRLLGGMRPPFQYCWKLKSFARSSTLLPARFARWMVFRKNRV